MAMFERTAEGGLQLNRIDLDIMVYGALELAKTERELEFVRDSITTVVEIVSEQIQEQNGWTVD